MSAPPKTFMMDTPIIRQYLEIKEQYRDAILFFRMGDFYEMFYEDAQIASSILEIALTSRNRKAEVNVPLCGVPAHAAQGYVAKLVQAGYKVAVCEQVQDGQNSKGILARKVVRVVTPGTFVEDEGLSPRINTFLACVVSDSSNRFGIAYVDLSTGEFKTTEGEASGLANEILRIAPRELIRPKTFSLLSDQSMRERAGTESLSISEIEDLALEQAGGRLIDQFRVTSLDAFNLHDHDLSVRACGGLLTYLHENQSGEMQHLRPPEFYVARDFLILDESSRKNLEIFGTREDRKRKGSLLGVLDETVTAMGGRKLRQWLTYPLVDPERIQARIDGVLAFVEHDLICQEIRVHLKAIHDLQRLAGKIALGNINARDLLALKSSLQEIPPLIAKLSEMKALPSLLACVTLDPLEDVAECIARAIDESPPLTIKEGGIIRIGYHTELDELRTISQDGKGWIARLEQEERRKTGISSLKIRYNHIFGYYIEVTRSNFHLVPEYYERKQTLSNAERFLIPELKSYAEKVLNAEERINELEYEIFCEIRSQIGQELNRIQKTADTLALLDVLTTFAHIALLYDYQRPIVDILDRIDISDGRHPVVERMNLSERFVPNDTHLDQREQIIILTGPNMAGKSTYMRQVALIVLMAQIGSFVPARRAEIGVVDQIFTRIGAGDHLALGESTFMVEMKETANILRHASRRSLILLDEIGRGTSTFDGVSIAWAVAEFLHDHTPFGAKTLFATHYHELAELAEIKSRIRNYNVSVKEWSDRIIFLRKIARGATSHSYGIEVARLAGLPQIVIERAREILKNLEKIEANIACTSANEDESKQKKAMPKSSRGSSVQLSLFGNVYEQLVAELRQIRLEEMTPLDAFKKLEELVRKSQQV